MKESLAKRQRANGRPDDVDELMADVISTIQGIRRSRTKLRGCVLQLELPLFFVLLIALSNVR
jgi:hypothetical protein